MDADRFDALSRSLHRSSRRRALGLLSGLALGSAAFLHELGDAEAKHTKRHKQGPKPKKPKKPKKPNKPPKKACRSLGSFCHGPCDVGPCDVCCSGHCGSPLGNSDRVCCVANGKACPKGCKEFEACETCCSGHCSSGPTCF